MPNKKNKKNSVKKKQSSKKRTVKKYKPGPSASPADKSGLTLDQLLTAVRSEPDNIGFALTLAEYYNNHGRGDKIIETISDFESRYPFADIAQRGQYNRLMTYGYLHLGRYTDSERMVERGRIEFPDSLDFHYAKCFLSIHLREFDSALESGHEYLKIRDKINSGEIELTPFSSSGSHYSKLLNYLGAAYREKRQFDEAEKYLEMAITEDPGNHFPYLNLATMLASIDEREKAEAVIQRGLKACSQIQELRMLSESLDKKASISACLIVKNEEDLLPDCLESIRDWVDEIIVVDTGSTDRTVEIAESYGAKIFHQPWEGNFSKHRNYSLEQATGDWLFIIDADERMCREDIPEIRRFVNDPDCPAIVIDVFNLYRDKNQSATFLPSCRFFRRELNLRYQGIVHNQLFVPDDVPVQRAGIKLMHLGYDLDETKMAQKRKRSEALLLKQLEEDPNDTFAMYNLAQLYRGGFVNFKEAEGNRVLELAGKIVEILDENNQEKRHIYLMALDQLAWTHFYFRNYEKTIEYCEWALRLKPDYLDPLLLTGHVYCRTRRHAEAYKWYNRYLETQAKFDFSHQTDNIILYHGDSRSHAYYNMAIMAELDNKPEAARRYYLKTVEDRPGFLQAYSLLGQSFLKEKDYDKAIEYFKKQLDEGEPVRAAVVGLGQIYFQKKMYHEAEKYFIQAREIAPDDPSTFLQLGKFYLETSRENQALKMFQAAREKGSLDSTNEMELADIYFKKGKYREAEEIYLNLLESVSERADIFNNLGNCQYKQENFSAAEEYYLKALEESPDKPIIYRNLGLTRSRLGKLKEAIVVLEKYYDLNREEYDILHVIGDLYRQNKDYNAAISCYEKFLSFKPEDSLALYNLSECYLNMGHKDSAILGYRRILQIDKDFEPAQHRLIQLEQPVSQV